MASEKENGKSPPAARPVNVAVTTLAKAHLECLAGPEKGQVLRVAPASTIIGRDPSCDIVLSETAISRHHCRIERRAEQWHLRNLSANGTLLNKKPADDSLLADGDEIRIGAKTRLRFVVESVTLSSTGRPQFRRRTGAPEEGEPGEDAAEEPQENKPSLLQRRKGVFIGLGIYLAIMLLFGAVVGYYKYLSPQKIAGGDIPFLGEEDSVRLEPGTKPLPIHKEDANGVYVANPTGGPSILVPAADFATGKAVRIMGIRKAIDVTFLEAKKAHPRYPYTIDEVNPAHGKECVAQAMELYRVRDLPGKEAALFGAVRLFQQALAYNGGRWSFQDTNVDKVYTDARKDLVDTITRFYSNAAGPEEKADPKRAMETYKRILRMIPDPDNPIYINVSRRMTALNALVTETK
ncbi:MAG: FHA domain-containing protein [Planctomycetota bacterium]|nr:FHA domain-containing protein [Planctomycetota bacterium]